MRRLQRLIAAAVVIALSGVLAGCSSSLTNWEPSDLLDFLDTKKTLRGERKPVFPEGVPGLEQGVPKELYRSNVEQRQQQEAAAAAAAAAQTVEQPKPQKSAKKGKARQPAAAPASAPASTADGEAAPEEDRPSPTHRASARSTCTAARAACSPAAAGGYAISGADAERQFSALRSR